MKCLHLHKCSGMQISSYVKESIEKNVDLKQELDRHNSMQIDVFDKLYKKVNDLEKKSYGLPVALKTWSKFLGNSDNVVKTSVLFFQNLQKIPNLKI